MAYKKSNANGQAAMSASEPVVIASDQSTLPINRVDTTASGNITTQNLVPAGVATANSAVEATSTNGFTSAIVQTTGTYTGALSLQGTVDGSVWVTFGAAGTFYNINTGIFNGTIPSAATSIYQVNITGMQKIRVTGLSAMSGTAVVSIRLTSAQSSGALNASLPSGSNVIGAITTIVPATGATNLGKAEDAGHTTGDVGVMSLGVRADAGASGNPTALAGTSLDYIPLATDANNRLYSNDAGAIAHDTADNSANNPVKVGGQARTTNPTAVADGDVANYIADKLGKQVTVQSIRDLKTQQITTITASTSETTILTAVASTFLDVYAIFITNTSATATEVHIKDATAGTTRVTLSAPANDTRGFVLTESAAIPQATVNNNWTATAVDSVSSLIITVLAVKNL